MDCNENGISHRSGIIQEATDKFHERKESGKTMVDRVNDQTFPMFLNFLVMLEQPPTAVTDDLSVLGL
jgi:hypothetical protein